MGPDQRFTKVTPPSFGASSARFAQLQPDCLPSPLWGGNPVTQWSPNLFYCFGRTTRNSHRSLESVCGGEDSENRAVLKSVTILITLEGGWDKEGRQHFVRAVTTQVYVHLRCKRALLPGKFISPGNPCKQRQQLLCMEKYVYESLDTHPGRCGIANSCSSAAYCLGQNFEFAALAGSLNIDKQGANIIYW